MKTAQVAAPIDIPSGPPEEPATASLAIARIEPRQEVGLFGTTEPVAVVAKATAVADALKGVIVRQGLVSKISGKEYPRCEAWTLLGTMLGVFPVTLWTKQVEDGWEARVEARTKDGAVIGAAEAQCLKSEKNWSDRDDFALRSMAQTRATAKCLRMPLGFVMTLAGYEATPAEEMVSDHPKATQTRAKPPQSDFDANSTPRPPSGKANPGTPPAKPRFATVESRKWMIGKLAACRELAEEYFRKVTNPDALMPNETLDDLPFQFVPITKDQMAALQDAITAFGNGEPAKHAFPPNPTGQEQPLKAAPRATTPAAKPPPAPSVAAAKAKDPKWFFGVFCPVPHRGQTKSDYEKNPETIGDLYVAMKDGDTEAQKRLWGFANHFNPQPREYNGKVYQPSEADHAFREALDAFVEWEARHGKDTTGNPASPDPDEERSPFD